jgi:putative endonuclease
MNKLNRKEIGNSGEDSAALFLENGGFLIIKKNFRTRGGEIDIIATQGEVLVFVEVKTSTKFPCDSLEYSIDRKKRERIIESSKYFLFQFPEYEDYTIRYDIIFVSKRDCKVIHIKNAFYEG